MEGLAAFGLACNVIQLIDTSFKVIDIYHHIRERGTNAQVENLTQSTKQLSELSATLRQSLDDVSNNALHLKSDVDLLEVCERCSDVVQPLEQEFAALTIGPGAGRKAAIKQFFKLKRKAGRIDQARQKLDTCVQDLDSSILIHLR